MQQPHTNESQASYESSQREVRAALSTTLTITQESPCPIPALAGSWHTLPRSLRTALRQPRMHTGDVVEVISGDTSTTAAAKSAFADGDLAVAQCRILHASSESDFVSVKFEKKKKAKLRGDPSAKGWKRVRSVVNPDGRGRRRNAVQTGRVGRRAIVERGGPLLNETSFEELQRPISVGDIVTLAPSHQRCLATNTRGIHSKSRYLVVPVDAQLVSSLLAKDQRDVLDEERQELDAMFIARSIAVLGEDRSRGGHQVTIIDTEAGRAARPIVIDASCLALVTPHARAITAGDCVRRQVHATVTPTSPAMDGTAIVRMQCFDPTAKEKLGTQTWFKRDAGAAATAQYDVDLQVSSQARRLLVGDVAVLTQSGKDRTAGVSSSGISRSRLLPGQPGVIVCDIRSFEERVNELVYGVVPLACRGEPGVFAVQRSVEALESGDGGADDDDATVEGVAFYRESDLERRTLGAPTAGCALARRQIARVFPVVNAKRAPILPDLVRESAGLELCGSISRGPFISMAPFGTMQRGGDSAFAPRTETLREGATCGGDGSDGILSPDYGDLYGCNMEIFSLKTNSDDTAFGKPVHQKTGEGTAIYRLRSPSGIAMNGDGELLIADTDNNAIAIVGKCMVDRCGVPDYLVERERARSAEAAGLSSAVKTDELGADRTSEGTDAEHKSWNRRWSGGIDDDAVAAALQKKDANKSAMSAASKFATGIGAKFSLKSRLKGAVARLGKALKMQENMWQAAFSGNSRMVRHNIDKMAAAHREHIDTGHSLNHPICQRTTPEAAASMNGHRNCHQRLLRAGADVVRPMHSHANDRYFSNSIRALQGHGGSLLVAPRDVAVDAHGNIFVADTGNACIRAFTPAMDHIATWGGVGLVDGKFLAPCGIAPFIKHRDAQHCQWQYHRQAIFIVRWLWHTGLLALCPPFIVLGEHERLRLAFTTLRFHAQRDSGRYPCSCDRCIAVVDSSAHKLSILTLFHSPSEPTALPQLKRTIARLVPADATGVALIDTLLRRIYTRADVLLVRKPGSDRRRKGKNEKVQTVVVESVELSSREATNSGYHSIFQPLSAAAAAAAAAAARQRRRQAAGSKSGGVGSGWGGLERPPPTKGSGASQQCRPSGRSMERFRGFGSYSWSAPRVTARTLRKIEVKLHGSGDIKEGSSAPKEGSSATSKVLDALSDNSWRSSTQTGLTFYRPDDKKVFNLNLGDVLGPAKAVPHFAHMEQMRILRDTLSVFEEKQLSREKAAAKHVAWRQFNSSDDDDSDDNDPFSVAIAAVGGDDHDGGGGVGGIAGGSGGEEEEEEDDDEEEHDVDEDDEEAKASSSEAASASGAHASTLGRGRSGMMLWKSAKNLTSLGTNASHQPDEHAEGGANEEDDDEMYTTADAGEYSDDDDMDSEEEFAAARGQSSLSGGSAKHAAAASRLLRELVQFRLTQIVAEHDIVPHEGEVFAARRTDPLTGGTSVDNPLLIGYVVRVDLVQRWVNAAVFCKAVDERNRLITKDGYDVYEPKMVGSGAEVSWYEAPLFWSDLVLKLDVIDAGDNPWVCSETNSRQNRVRFTNLSVVYTVPDEAGDESDGTTRGGKKKKKKKKKKKTDQAKCCVVS